MVTGDSIRYSVEPRDVPPIKAARRLHLTLKEFNDVKDELFRRGFPHPDPTTGYYFLPDVDEWMENRNKNRADTDAEALMLDRIDKL